MIHSMQELKYVNFIQFHSTIHTDFFSVRVYKLYVQL